MGGFAGTPRFEVLAQLGRGGMGVVYRARDRERATVVAIKTLRRLEPETVLRLKIEFRSLQDLEHPNLVNLGELFEADGQWFYTMELVDGVDFLAWVRPGADGAFEATTRPSDLSSSPVGVHTLGGEIDEGRLRDALAQLAGGLGALHAAGKVHRDVKPSNVMVDGEGRVVLLDFGLVSDIAEDDLSDHRVVGTTSYMAPEQAVSASVGPAADWYSVGVMLHQALTGALPFNGPPLVVLMDKQRHEPPPPRALVPAIPRDLDQLCSELLRIDPARRPGAAEVLERLHGRASRPLRAASSAPSLGPTPPFVGRTAELGELRAAAAAVGPGRPVAVIVHGDSGVGKSALLRHFTEELARQRPDTVVLAGRCYERESVPFKAVDGVIDALARHLMRVPRAEVGALLPRRAGLVAQVFPVLGRVEAFAAAPRLISERLDPLELRTRLFDAVRELLARLADRGPLVLVIDDLQWADLDSLELLADVLQPPDGPGLLLLATARAGESPAGVDARLLRVDALPPAEALELTGLLAERLGQGGDAPALATIAAEAGGHPLFIDELIRHALLGGRPGRLDLDDALWARISKLDDGERRVLTLCAVAGAPLAQEVAARAAELALGELQRLVAVLRVANLVRTRGPRPTDTIEAYHDRVRAGHERLALALETAEHPDAEALALHWHEAGRPDQAARHALVAAEQAAAALAFDRAARLYQIAVELAPAGTDLGALQARLGDALANAGRGAGAAAAYLAAAGDAATAEALELRRRAADQLLRSGHIDEGLAALDDVLAAVGLRLPRSPGRALWSLALRRAHVRLRGLRHRRRDAGEVPPRDLTRIDVCWSAA
ncbi:MAG TPA: AAA family ATPase, partial [Kofleriaceae bacterium]|nr:AAA family ATPase [Kofleriaceae bacterium]